MRTLRPGDTSCARRVPELRLVPSFARTLDAVDAARPRPGDEASENRRIAVAATRTVADVVSRWWLNYDGTGVGLRAGSWRYSDDVVAFELRWTLARPLARASLNGWVGRQRLAADMLAP